MKKTTPLSKCSFCILMVCALLVCAGGFFHSGGVAKAELVIKQKKRKVVDKKKNVPLHLVKEKSLTGKKLEVTKSYWRKENNTYYLSASMKNNSSAVMHGAKVFLQGYKKGGAKFCKGYIYFQPEVIKPNEVGYIKDGKLACIGQKPTKFEYYITKSR